MMNSSKDRPSVDRERLLRGDEPFDLSDEGMTEIVQGVVVALSQADVLETFSILSRVRRALVDPGE